MTKSKSFKLMLTEGGEESLIGVIDRTVYPDENGNILPPLYVEYCDQSFIIDREFMPGFYIYKLDEKVPESDPLFD